MSKFIIAAVAATLLGSTAGALAEPAIPNDNQAAFFASQQYVNPQINSARNAQAFQVVRDNGRRVKAATTAENAYFNAATPQTAN